jgi:hypothetical protein
MESQVFVVQNLDEAVKAVSRVGDLSRAHCREVFERRFSASRMASDYVAVYKDLIESGVGRNRLIASTLPPLGKRLDKLTTIRTN